MKSIAIVQRDHTNYRARRAWRAIPILAALFTASVSWPANAHAQHTGWYMSRHTTGGAPDSTFTDGNQNGIRTGLLSGAKSWVVLNQVRESPFGSKELVSAGYFNATTNKNFSMVISRYNSDGSPDTSFGFGGVMSVLARAGSSEEADSIAFQRSQKIIVGGATLGDDLMWRAFVGRFNWDGTLDSTFGNNGFVFNFRASSLTLVKVEVLTDDSIIVAATADSKIAISKYLSDGSHDTTFGPSHNGTISQTCGTSGCNENDFVIDPLGGIVVAGTSDLAFSSQAGFVARFTPAGNLDTSFGSGGFSSIPNAHHTSHVAAAKDNLGNTRIVALSSMTNGMIGLQRLTARGVVEPSFVRTFNFAGQRSQYPAGVRIRSAENRILLGAGTTDTNSVRGIGVAAVLLDTFAMDSTTFGTSGRTVTKQPSVNTITESFTVDSSGRPLTCGSFR